jgi:plasmid stability protein
LLSLTALLRHTSLLATITIRNLDETVKRKLQVRAALNGRSMEEKVRCAVGSWVMEAPVSSGPEEDLGTAIHRRFAEFGGV